MQDFEFIELYGVRQNNLKNISVRFPRNQLSVITGLSGSGKSSLAFETLYAEGQRRYIESLSTYTRQFLEKMKKPDVDFIKNIPPAIALEQKNNLLSQRSTIATYTEIADYLKVLFSKLGTTICPSCQKPVETVTPHQILHHLLPQIANNKILITTPWNPSFSHLELQKNGFHRVLIPSQASTLEIAALEDLPIIFTPHSLLIDRLKITESHDPETQTRLLDSIEQGLKIGSGILHCHIFTDSILAQPSQVYHLGLSCLQCGAQFTAPEPAHFSFNHPSGACAHCHGFGYTLDLSEDLIVPDPTKTFKNGAIDPLSKPSFAQLEQVFFHFLESHGISIGTRYQELTSDQKTLLWEGSPSSKFPGIRPFFKALERKRYQIHMRVFVRRYQTQSLCTQCHGTRLGPRASSVQINQKTLPQVYDLTLPEILSWIQSITMLASEELLKNIKKRLQFLIEVGMPYLTLSRTTKTLSGGEFQRVNLATQLSSGLCGTLYVLDEPSVGLHAADTQKLIQILKRLRDQGNTVVLVEHDLEILHAADWIIELGPGPGIHGGELIAQGIPTSLLKIPGSLTGKYLSTTFKMERQRPLRPAPQRCITLTGCQAHNLKNLTVSFPLHRLVVVSGVSGSGKSTLIHGTLFQALSQRFHPHKEPIGAFQTLTGSEHIRGVVLIDQAPIGHSSRSNPATYLKIWDEIRKIFSQQMLAQRRGYTPQHFSFNSALGRCPTCEGKGLITLDMHFLADLEIECETCLGKRFKKEILDVTYRGQTLDSLLQTPLHQAATYFHDHPLLTKKFQLFQEVGLDYLKLGQALNTLSGGELQRLKIATALENRHQSHFLYIFDEPTRGLHCEDIKKLIFLIQNLIDSRHSVILIEHHLDVIAQADWVIDLGPEGGSRGGQILFQGTPQNLKKHPHSITGKMLAQSHLLF